MIARINFKEGQSFVKFLEVKNLEKITYLSDVDGSTIEISDFQTPFLLKSREFTFVGDSIITVSKDHINCVEFRKQ